MVLGVKAKPPAKFSRDRHKVILSKTVIFVGG